MTRTPTTVPSVRGNRDFNLLWLGEGVSALGSMTTLAVLPLLAVTQLGASSAWMGLLTACLWLPWLVLGLPAGAWIDRGDNRRILIGSDLFAAAVYASIPIAWVLGRLTLPWLVCVALGGGVKEVFFRTAYPGLITRVASPEDLERANSRLVGTESAMQVTGPGLGGRAVQLFSAANAIILDVVSFLVSAWCLWRIRLPEVERTDANQPPTAREPLRRMISDGLRVTFGDPFLRWFTVTGSVSNFALTGYQTLLVLWMVRELSVSPGSVGLLLAVGGSGGLVGAAVAQPVSRRLGSARALLLLQLTSAPSALLIGAARPGAGIWPLPVGMVFVGLGVVGANVIRGAFRQRWTPPDLLGRTISASAVVNYGSMPLAGLLAGSLGTAIDLGPTIVAMAGIHAATCLATLASPWARLRDLPSGVMLTDPGTEAE